MTGGSLRPGNPFLHYGCWLGHFYHIADHARHALHDLPILASEAAGAEGENVVLQ